VANDVNHVILVHRS